MRNAKKFKVFSTGFKVVKPRVLQVLDSITVGDVTYSGEIMEKFGWNKRRSLEYLDKLEKLEYLTSEHGVLIQSPKTGAVVPARVFKRIK